MELIGSIFLAMERTLFLVGVNVLLYPDDQKNKGTHFIVAFRSMLLMILDLNRLISVGKGKEQTQNYNFLFAENEIYW